jgi:hypothetical protein
MTPSHVHAALAHGRMSQVEPGTPVGAHVPPHGSVPAQNASPMHPVRPDGTVLHASPSARWGTSTSKQDGAIIVTSS